MQSANACFFLHGVSVIVGLSVQSIYSRHRASLPMTVQNLGYDCLEIVSSECPVLCHTVDMDLDTIASFDVFFANTCRLSL